MKKILLWGGGTQTFICENIFLNNRFKINKKNFKISYVYDSSLKKLSYKTSGKFINDKTKIEAIIKKSDSFMVCIGGVKLKAKKYLSLKLEDRGLQPQDFVCKSTYIDKGVLLGFGNTILEFTKIMSGTKIGNFNLINNSAQIGHSVTINNFVHIAPMANILGRCLIEDEVYVGASATILPDVVLGKGSIIADGAVVTKDVKPGTFMVGVPAKTKKINSADFITNINKEI